MTYLEISRYFSITAEEMAKEFSKETLQIMADKNICHKRMAASLSITPEGIRKIEHKAIKKLLDNPEAMELLRSISEQYQDHKPHHGPWDTLAEWAWSKPEKPE